MILQSMTSSHLVIFLKGGFLRMYSGLEVMIDLGFNEFGSLSRVGDLFYHAGLVLVSTNSDGWVK